MYVGLKVIITMSLNEAVGHNYVIHAPVRGTPPEDQAKSYTMIKNMHG